MFNIQELKGYSMDKILFEASYPILFTCKNEHDDILLCVCCQNEPDETIWLVTGVDPKKVISLLKNEITIREAFEDKRKRKYTIIRDNKSIFLADDKKNKLIWGKDSHYLPDVGEYLEAEDDEFDLEIKYFSSFIREVKRIDLNKFNQDGCYRIGYTTNVMSKKEEKYNLKENEKCEFSLDELLLVA